MRLGLTLGLGVGVLDEGVEERVDFGFRGEGDDCIERHRDGGLALFGGQCWEDENRLTVNGFGLPRDIEA